MPSFTCADGKTIHFTLVCDFHEDCDSDEFCEHPSCGSQYTCLNHQCVAAGEYCDNIQHCRDRSDEHILRCLAAYEDVQHVSPPAVVRFNTKGHFINVPLKNGEGCPETHVQCPDSYCLPVYMMCNVVYDCPGREDEVRCEEYTCPGFYRCRSSTVCLHPDHLCDGVFQCPLQDDELYCDVTCPLGCRCRGLAGVCPQAFSAHDHPELRFVDASNSNMTLLAFRSNVYLVHLVLQNCQLSTLNFPSLRNLQVLDVSKNTIPFLHTSSFILLYNLVRLLLSENPISYVTGADAFATQSNLLLVDLSRTQIQIFDSGPFRVFREMKTLNLSSSAVSDIASDGMQNIPELQVLDLRGTPLEIFPGDVFLGLRKLSRIYADNFKLCCRATLPRDFDPNNCLAPVDELSSCEDLLHTDVYRVCLWVLAVMATAGNVGSAFFKILFQKDSKSSGFNVFVLQLSISDLLMGLYLVLIGSADIRYRGQYLWYDVAWKESGLCKAAGFLSLMSAEVSAFIIFLITVDRFVVFKFPFSDVRFSHRSALAACGVAWLVGAGLAAVPLLPATAHWRYYSQTSVCIPLPITRKDFAGRRYSFGVMIVLNLVVFLMIAAGQVVIYWSIHSNSIAASTGSSQTTGRKNLDTVIVRRLATVVVSDFLCWFPIGVLGVLSSAGVAIPGWLNVAVAILVLPINSAVNPFLYTYTLLMERRRKVRRASRQKAVDTVMKNYHEERQREGSSQS